MPTHLGRQSRPREKMPRKEDKNQYMYYHVVTDLEKKFSSLKAAMEAYQGVQLTPQLPKSKLEDENYITPRLCVCEWLPDCLTGIGLQTRLKRCLSANDNADSYATKFNEVYPVLVLEFPDYTNVYTPSEADVADIELTHEKWILRKIVPDKVTLKWLGPNSILFDNPTEDPCQMRAISCQFVTDFQNKDHPWLNGRGHTLVSQKQENEFEDYGHLPMGKYLGNIQTLKSTLKQIDEIMSWKRLIGEHYVEIKSEPIPNNNLANKTWLQIICLCKPEKAPELYLQLVQENPEGDQSILAQSENFSSLDELERVGIQYQNNTYRTRIWTINADNKTGIIPNQQDELLTDLQNMTPEELADAGITINNEFGAPVNTDEGA